MYHTKEYYQEVTNASKANVTTSRMYTTPTIPQATSSSSAIQFPSTQGQKSAESQKQFQPGFQVKAKPAPPKFQGILIERFRKALKQRGNNSVIGLGRAFKIADDNGSGALDFAEFQKCVRDFGLNLDPIDVQGLFKSMDLDQSGQIDFNEFLRVVIGEMNPFRQ